MGIFDKIFGGEKAPEAPQEEQKPEGLSEEKEKEFFDKGDEMGKEGKKVDEEKWMKEGEKRNEAAETPAPEAPAEKPEQ